MIHSGQTDCGGEEACFGSNALLSSTAAAGFFGADALADSTALVGSFAGGVLVDSATSR